MERKCVINFALMKPFILLLLRVLLGAVFILAAYGKLLHPEVLVSTVINFNILPLGLSKIFAYTLPWIEMIAGIMLIIGFGTRGASFAIAWLLISFIIAIGINMHRGVSMECGCFDIFGMNEKIGSEILLRDVIFFLIAAALVLTKEFLFSVDTFMERKSKQ